MLGWSRLDTSCPPSCCVTLLLFRTGQGENKLEENIWVKIKGSLIKQKKALQKQRKPKVLLSTSNQQTISSHSLGNRASVHGAIAPEDKCHSKKCPPPLSLSFCCWADITWYGISLWAVWVSCPGYVASKICVCYLPTTNVRETMLRLCESFSTTAKTLVCYQDFSSYKYKAQPCEACCGKINSTSAKRNTVNYDISSIIFDGEFL